MWLLLVFYRFFSVCAVLGTLKIFPLLFRKILVYKWMRTNTWRFIFHLWSLLNGHTDPFHIGAVALISLVLKLSGNSLNMLIGTENNCWENFFCHITSVLYALSFVHWEDITCPILHTYFVRFSKPVSLSNFWFQDHSRVWTQLSWIC